MVWVTVVALQILLNDKYKFESLQGDGSRTRQEITQTAGCKARACKFLNILVTFLAKKVVFERENLKFTIFSPPGKIFLATSGKIAIGFLLEKSFRRPLPLSFHKGGQRGRRCLFMKVS